MTDYADLVRRLQRYRFKTTDQAAAAIEALVAERDDLKRERMELARELSEERLLCDTKNRRNAELVAERDAKDVEIKELRAESDLYFTQRNEAQMELGRLRSVVEAEQAEVDRLRPSRNRAEAMERERDEWKAKYLATKALPVGGQLLKAMPVGWHGDTTNPRGDDSDPEGL